MTCDLTVCPPAVTMEIEVGFLCSWGFFVITCKWYLKYTSGSYNMFSQEFSFLHFIQMPVTEVKLLLTFNIQNYYTNCRYRSHADISPVI